MYGCPNARIQANPVALAQNGDQDALEVLLRRYYRPLRAFIAPMVGTSHADDVLQEIALAIFQNLRYLRHPGAFRSWAFRIASRRAFRHLKCETRWKFLENRKRWSLGQDLSIEGTAIVLDIPVGTAKSRQVAPRL